MHVNNCEPSSHQTNLTIYPSKKKVFFRDFATNQLDYNYKSPLCFAWIQQGTPMWLPFEFRSTIFARDRSQVGLRQENIWKTSAKLFSTAAELRTGQTFRLPQRLPKRRPASFAAKLPPTVANDAFQHLSTIRSISQLAGIIWIPIEAPTHRIHV